MLEGDLESSKHPAKALLEESSQPLRSLCQSHGLGLVDDFPSTPLHSPCEICIFCKRVSRVPPDIQQRFTPPSTNSAGNDSDDVAEIESSAIKVLACDVFQRLKSREQ